MRTSSKCIFSRFLTSLSACGLCFITARYYKNEIYYMLLSVYDISYLQFQENIIRYVYLTSKILWIMHIQNYFLRKWYLRFVSMRLAWETLFYRVLIEQSGGPAGLVRVWESLISWSITCIGLFKLNSKTKLLQLSVKSLATCFIAHIACLFH